MSTPSVRKGLAPAHGGDTPAGLNPLSAVHHEFLETLGLPVSAQASPDELRSVLAQAELVVTDMDHPLLAPLSRQMLDELQALVG